MKTNIVLSEFSENNIKMKKEAKEDIIKTEQEKAAKETEVLPISPLPGKLRVMKNLLVVCLGFFFLYLPFQALASLQSTMNVEGNVGVVSQTIIYTTIILSALFLPKLLIKKLGCKVTLVLCILTFVPYFAANFYPSMETFVPTAVLLGIGGGPLWSAKCTYINEISVIYSGFGSDSADIITSRFFGIFFMIFQNTQIFGNLVSFYVLKPYESVFPEQDSIRNFSSVDDTIVRPPCHSENISCGADFCGGMNDNLIPPSDEKRYMLISVYLSSVLFSAVIVTVFLDPLKTKQTDNKNDGGVMSRVIATLKHLKNTDQMLLVPLTIFNGIEQAFILGDYSKAYVACAWGVHNVGLVFICYGVVNATMSFLAGRLVKYVPRMVLFFVGALSNVGVCTALLLWEPNSEEFVYFFVLIGFWGMSDGIWLTQINAFYGVLFRAEEEAAFANFKLWESVGFSLAFGYSIFLCISYKIYILLGFLGVGITGYLTVEMRTRLRRHAYDVSSS